MAAIDDFKTRIRPVLMHEAAHSVVGHRLGLPTGDIQIELDEGGASGSSQVDLRMHFSDIEEIIEYLPKRCVMLYAGCIAQSFDEQGYDETACDFCSKSNGANDEAKARENLRLYCNISFGTDKNYDTRMRMAEDGWRDEALRLVNLHKAEIDKLADALLGYVDKYDLSITMTEADITALRGGP